MATTTDSSEQHGTEWMCAQCREAMSPNANVCPQCGYDGTPSIRERLGFARRRMAIFGWAVTVIGLPMARRRWRQYKQRKAELDGQPAVPADE